MPIALISAPMRWIPLLRRTIPTGAVIPMPAWLILSDPPLPNEWLEDVISKQRSDRPGPWQGCMTGRWVTTNGIPRTR